MRVPWKTTLWRRRPAGVATGEAPVPQVDLPALRPTLHWRLFRRGTPVAISCLALMAGAAAVPELERKRDRTRYEHYAGSVDYHDISRHGVSAWQACDEPGRPHVVALAHPRRGRDEKSTFHAVLDWFFYPLLGSRWQNKVVYASVHEARDVPSPGHFGGVSDETDRTIWLRNLRRLGVDRIVVAAGASPEESWVATDPATFRLIDRGPYHCVYRVDQDTLASALAEPPDVTAVAQTEPAG